MSALLLCQDCLSWQAPLGHACPHCGCPLDASEPDPPIDSLRNIVGEIVSCLGEVTTSRRHLPNRGLLYATTTGLAFVPHRIEYQMLPEEEESTTSIILWSILGLIFTPLVILKWIFYPHQKLRVIASPIPRRAVPGESTCLVDWMMDDPGTFFIPHRSIHELKPGWLRWWVRCIDRPHVCFRPREPRNFFLTKLRALAEFSPWHSLVWSV
ncbi:RING finger protein [Calycomorphotria hydatis]|uniref:Uncharacterized protein n=1 Tax=Calycomorphotria hydatis TaxID=2528027 RepID=A0A517T7J5_9PLAN|nr:hypothetical protein [Calycomorphotria hydatis]QDT64320.1 hypothetical protein V22_15520 [Calycomorphotria hydatis]